MRSETIVPLINGLWHGGQWHGRAVLRPLSGAEETLLSEAGAALPAQLTTWLITATTRSIGEVEPVSHESARALTIGDRERLLLALHAISFAPQIDVVVRCAHAACGERIELALNLAQLLAAPPASPPPAAHTLTIAAADGALNVSFRLPNGGDHEAAARLAGDLPRAADRLLTRCILSVTDERGRAREPDAVIGAVREPLVDALRTLDPAAETVARFECPACGHEGRALLDAFTLLRAELARSSSILADVSRLARAYHWSEADILALPIARRRRYLALLASGASA